MPNEKKLHILMLAVHPCIRVYKEAQALKARGHTISLACESILPHQDWSAIASEVFLYSQPSELVALLQSRSFDIIHGHNEPNWHIYVAIKCSETTPVVYDCHDYSGLYQELNAEESHQEQVCFEEADACIHVSESMVRLSSAVVPQKHSLVLYSLPSIPQENIVKGKKLPGQHVAYEGNISHLDRGPGACRFYYPAFQELAQQDIVVHIFPACFTDNATRNLYMGEGKGQDNIRFYPHQSYEKLLQYMTRYTWGFSGFNFSPEWDAQHRMVRYLNAAMPNKLFEYLLAGLTPVVIHCEEAGNFVTKHNIGYHVEDMQEFVHVIQTAEPLAHNVSPGLLDMNVQIVQLENLYYQILAEKVAKN